MGEEIITNHGPLLKMYYSYGDGQKQAGDDEHVHGDLSKVKTGQWGAFGKYDFISEGDSPSYLHLIDVGLGNIQHPEYGGWGGRLKQSIENPNRWEDGKEVADGAFDSARHHHGLRFTLKLLGLPDAGNEVIDHDLGFHLNGPRAGFDKGFQLFLRLDGVEQRVALY